ALASEMTRIPKLPLRSLQKSLSASRILRYPPTSHGKTNHEIFPRYASIRLLQASALGGCHLCSLILLSQSDPMPAKVASKVHTYGQSKFGGIGGTLFDILRL